MPIRISSVEQRDFCPAGPGNSASGCAWSSWPVKGCTTTADPAIVPTSPGALSLTQIMSQKYIAQLFWAHNEMWMDMRRYHYTADAALGLVVAVGCWAGSRLI